jgi:hypothetical protein
MILRVSLKGEVVLPEEAGDVAEDSEGTEYAGQGEEQE